MRNTTTAVATLSAPERNLVAVFGRYLLAMPAPVTTRLRWNVRVPEHSALGWPLADVQDLSSADLEVIPYDDLQQALEVAYLSLRPSGPADCLTATARLRAVARQRPSVEADEALSLTVYAEKLAKYPDDAVAMACEKWLETSPFWPAVSEILQACEWAMQRRRALAQMLERAKANHRPKLH